LDIKCDALSAIEARVEGWGTGMTTHEASQAAMPRAAHLDTLIARRFAAPGPKRILSLDGGGTRGVISLMFLAEIEAVLRDKLKKPDLVLSDYFDLIGGTSVGSMIATLLAAGGEVEPIRKVFEEGAPRIFEPKSHGLVTPMFDARVLRGLVQAEVFDWPLKSQNLKTGLCIVTKRVDTGSVWPVINNPADPYFLPRPGRGNNPARLGNGDYKLLDLIRASTAAPRYFSPKEIHIFEGVGDTGDPRDGRFVDGAVSPFNNPALQLFMMAGISGYNLGGGPLEPRGERQPWKLGADNLLIVSVGTGSFDFKVAKNPIAALHAIDALRGMIADGQDLGLTLLQWMSVPHMSWRIDRVIGDLSNDLLGDGVGLTQPLLSFQRYDVRLDVDWLENPVNCGRSLEPDAIEAMRDFTNHHVIGLLGEIGEAAAKKQVSATHFPESFDACWVHSASHSRS
jgi:predicted acylesterase/phospholipase RssA